MTSASKAQQSDIRSRLSKEWRPGRIDIIAILNERFKSFNVTSFHTRAKVRRVLKSWRRSVRQQLKSLLPGGEGFSQD
ncbi:hypothetical protein PO124_21095 [Bacillus licheniformis]|nr:hypothetical protein [Bacillus licheniformis]